MNDLRSLLYPLGFVAAALFAARFLLQWLQSEARGKSVVSRSFWVISLIGNCTMGVHLFIQLQYPLCLIQGVNAVISWRNLNLMGKTPRTFSFVLQWLGIVLLAITSGFALQGNWIRIPILPWDLHPAEPISVLWPIVGMTGAAIFATRFWLQWWSAERQHKSGLEQNFWISSLVGAMLALVYFIRIEDWVNIIGYGLGIIPYARNIVLLRRHCN